MRPQAAAMKAPSRPACMDQLFLQHRFPPAVIKHAIWLYLGFTPSYRDVEGLFSAGAA